MEQVCSRFKETKVEKQQFEHVNMLVIKNAVVYNLGNNLIK